MSATRAIFMAKWTLKKVSANEKRSLCCMSIILGFTSPVYIEKKYIYSKSIYRYMHVAGTCIV